MNNVTVNETDVVVQVVPDEITVTITDSVGIPAGGTANQVLKKNSSTDYDVSWASDVAGVPYTGATQDVNLGEFGLLTGNIEFDTTPTNAPTGAGSMVWNDTEGTIDLVLKGGNLVLPIGQKQTILAVNGTGGNLTRAQYRAVKITGAQGQRLQVSLARADNDANSKDTIGIVGEDISNNQTGFIVSSGLVEEINTTGSLQGETWADGDTLYLSGTTYGVITNVKPAAPTHTVILGFVVYAHSQHGKIYVKVDNGYELDELHNVNVSTAASGDYLRYNGTTWVDATISASDLPTGIDAAKIATGTVSNTEFGYLDGVTSSIQTQLNGKQATLTLTTTGTSGAATLVGATLNIPQYQAVLTNPVTGTGVSGQVSFFNGTSTVTGDNGLFWDNTNKRLGVGTTTPQKALGILGGFSFGDQSASPQSEFSIYHNAAAATFVLRNATASQNAGFNIRSNSGTLALTMFGTTDNSQGYQGLGTLNIGANDFTLFSTTTGATPIARFFAGGNATYGGNSDAGYKLDIQGTLRNTTSAYFATSSGGVGIGTASVTSGYKLDVNGPVIFGGYKIQNESGFGTFRTNSSMRIATDANGIDLLAAGFGISLYVNSILGLFNSLGGNVGIGQTTFGTSATKTLAIGSGTAPTTSPADAFQLYSADITAGNAAPHFRTEGGAVVKIYQQTTGVGAATFVANTGTAVNDASTFGGYTLKQIVQALQNAGFLA